MNLKFKFMKKIFILLLGLFFMGNIYSQVKVLASVELINNSSNKNAVDFTLIKDNSQTLISNDVTLLPLQRIDTYARIMMIFPGTYTLIVKNGYVCEPGGPPCGPGIGELRNVITYNFNESTILGSPIKISVETGTLNAYINGIKLEGETSLE